MFSLVCLVIACVLFLGGAFWYVAPTTNPPYRVNLISLGLFFLALSFIKFP